MMLLKKSDVVDFKASVAVFGFLLLYFVYLVDNYLLRPQYIMVYTAFLSILYFGQIYKNARLHVIIGLFTTISLSFSFIKEDSIDFIFNSIYLFCFSIIIFLYLNYKISNWVHYSIMAIYLIFVFYKLFIGGVDPNAILGQRSRNMVSFYFLCFVILFDFSNYKNNNKINLIPVSLLCLLAFLMLGRAGIASSLFYFLCVVYIKYYYKRISFKTVFGYSLVLFMILVSLYLIFIDVITEGLVYFNSLGVDLTGRDEIWLRYLNAMETDEMKFLFGVPLDSELIFISYNFNLHNSLLSLHSYYGIFSFLFVLFLGYLLVFRKGILFYKLMLFVLIIRGLSDQIFFINFNDFVLYTIFFGLLFNIKFKINGNEQTS